MENQEHIAGDGVVGQEKTKRTFLVGVFAVVILCLLGVIGYLLFEKQEQANLVKSEVSDSEKIYNLNLETFEDMLQDLMSIGEWDVCHIVGDRFGDVYTHYPKGWYIYTLKGDWRISEFHYEQGCTNGGTFVTSPILITEKGLLETWTHKREADALLPTIRMEITRLDYRSQPQEPFLMLKRSEDNSLFLAANSEEFGIQVRGYGISDELMTLFVIKNMGNVSTK